MEVIKIYTVLENFIKTKFGEGQCLWLSYGPINHNIVDTLPMKLNGKMLTCALDLHCI